MKLKTDQNGSPLLNNGLPVWVDDQGAEHAYNVPQLIQDIQQLADQRNHQQQQLDSLQQRLAHYDGIDPQAARQALTQLDDIRHKRLIDAGEAQQVRQHIEEQFNAKLDESKKALGQRDEQIRNLIVRNAFDASTYLRDHTLLVPDMAYAYFGKHFAVEDRDGHPTPVAKLDGAPIMSPNRPGQLATPEEALRHIIDRHPDRDRMIKAGHPGGAGGSGARHEPILSRNWSQMTTDEQARYIDQHGLQAAKALVDAEA